MYGIRLIRSRAKVYITETETIELGDTIYVMNQKDIDGRYFWTLFKDRALSFDDIDKAEQFLYKISVGLGKGQYGIIKL